MRAVVHAYIRTGTPVGSETITRDWGIASSSATIRNVMGELEKFGYLTQPHPSAGRVPTEDGYRLVVAEYLKKMEGPDREDRPRTHLPKTGDLHVLLPRMVRRLALLTKQAAFIVSPRADAVRLKEIRFIRLRKDRLLVLTVSLEGVARSKILTVERVPPQGDLDRISRYLEEQFKGKTAAEIRREITAQMQRLKEEYNRLLKEALRLAQKAIDDSAGEELFFDGISRTLAFLDLPAMQSLLAAFEEKTTILHLLDRYIDQKGVQVAIGSENSALGTDSLSIVLANYRGEDRPLGTLAVIGPTRMDYATVIPLVHRMATRLSDLLGGISR